MKLSPLLRLAFPFAILIAALIVRYVIDTPDGFKAALDWLPWVSLTTALLLSAYNGIARLFTASLALLIVYWLVTGWLQVSMDDSEALRIYSLVSVVLPIQMLFLMVMPERGLWNRYGFMILASVSILSIAGLAAFLLVSEPELIGFIERYIPAKPVSGYVLSVYASVGIIAVIIAGLCKLSVTDSEHDAALVMTMLSMFLMLAIFDRADISDVMLSVAGITLLVAMVRGGYELAYLDDLTGLPGRRSLNDRLKGIGRQYTVAMLDVDRFKNFNDTWGHDAGDDVLKLIAKHIGEVGGGGTAYRYGGEEFCIVFPGRPDPESCIPFLEQVRCTVESYPMIVRDRQNRDVSPEVARERRGRRKAARDSKEVKVTVSIGVAGTDQLEGTPEDIIKAADMALYNAKKKGRNRLVSSNVKRQDIF